MYVLKNRTECIFSIFEAFSTQSWLVPIWNYSITQMSPSLTCHWVQIGSGMNIDSNLTGTCPYQPPENTPVLCLWGPHGVLICAYRQVQSLWGCPLLRLTTLGLPQLYISACSGQQKQFSFLSALSLLLLLEGLGSSATSNFSLSGTQTCSIQGWAGPRFQ